MKRILIPVSVLMLSVLVGCDGPWVYETGNGVMVSETRSIKGFDNVEINGAYEVVLEQGDKESLFIEADENLMEYIVTDLIGRRLKIFNEKSIKSDEGIQIRITYKRLEGITSAGASIVENRGLLTAPHVELELKGTGVIKLQLEVEELDVDLTGAGLIELEGIADIQRVHLKGAGNLSAYDLETEETQVRLSGVGAAQVFTTRLLDAEVQGIGHISYRGDPAQIEKQVSGLGKIEEDRDYPGF